MSRPTSPGGRRTRRLLAAGVVTCGLSLTATSFVPSALGAVDPAMQVTAPAGSPDVVDLTISQAQALLSSGKTTSVDLVKAYLARIDAYDDPYGDQPGINAILRINSRALAEAAALDAEREAGHVRGPLHGVPILIKDNYDTGDMPTTSGSAALGSFQPADDATMVARLRAAGAIVIAKTNLHEFAHGITTISSAGGQTHNPYDQQRNPGGSSGGTGAGLGASFAVAGLGTDTCGSIRIPAANQNLVGLRPTLGLTSRDGIAPMSHTQDVGGPIARTVSDVAAMLDAVVGVDPKDSSTADSVGHLPSSYAATVGGGLAGKKIGLVTNSTYLGTSAAEQPTTDLIHEAADELRAAGANVVEVTLPAEFVTALSGSGVITQELRDDINAYFAQEGATFDPAIAALTAPADKLTLSDIIATNTAISSVQTSLINDQNYDDSTANPTYADRLASRATAQSLLQAFFTDNGLDAIAYPTLKRTAQLIGQGQAGSNCSISAQTGFPALTMPAGFTSEHMPAGIEFLGLPWSEPTLLAIGAGFEKAGDHQEPPASTPELAKSAVSAAGLDATATRATYGSPTQVSVTVTSAVKARGQIALTYGGRQVATAAVVASGAIATVTATVPGGVLPAGTQTLGLTFTPAAGNASGQAKGVVVAEVGKRALSAATLKLRKKPTSKAAGAGTLRLATPAKLAKASGTATLKLTKGKRHKTVKVVVVAGVGHVRLPKLAKGTWKVSVSLSGSADYQASGLKVRSIRSKR